MTTGSAQPGSAQPGSAQPGSAQPGSARWWLERRAREARRRPRADGLTTERIIEAALAVVDAEGLDALTVRRLATDLSTGSASLYRHVASRDELLVLMVDDVMGGIRFPDASRPARERIEGLATELRRVLMAHPNLLPALTSAPLLGPNAMSGAERGLADMLDAGYPPASAIPGYLALIDYVLGTVYFDTSSAGKDSIGAMDRRELVEALPSDSFPTLRAHEDEFATPVEEVFTFGLVTFLDGMERRFLGA